MNEVERNMLALPAKSETCKRCDRPLTNLVSTYMAIGPICVRYWFMGGLREEIELLLSSELDALENDPNTLKRIFELREMVEIKSKQIGTIGYLDVEYLRKQNIQLSCKIQPKNGILTAVFRYGCDNFDAIKDAISYQGLGFRWYRDTKTKFWYFVDPTQEFLQKVKRTLDCYKDQMDLTFRLKLPHQPSTKSPMECTILDIGDEEFSIKLLYDCTNFLEIKNHIKYRAFGRRETNTWIVCSLNMAIIAEGLKHYGLKMDSKTKKLLAPFTPIVPEVTERTIDTKFNNLKQQIATVRLMKG